MVKLQDIFLNPWPSKRKPILESDLGSFTSSRVVLSRIAAWSGSNRRELLFVMNFHPIWQDSQCAVWGWYMQQWKSSTRFRSIEHRKNIEGPFFHEFLLLKLTDGAVCRVERTGDGSRADAVRYTGCSANDVIQWFSKEDYEKFEASTPSVLLSDVEFGREFDILDVLAVCYTIQRVQVCSVYTLQRYNCYFMCWTILAVLSRRVASWETAIETTKWDSTMAQAFTRFSEKSHAPRGKHLILDFCALLGSGNINPGKLITSVLTDSLTVRAGAPRHVNDALCATLWQTSWESAFRVGLTDALAHSVKDLLNSFASQRIHETKSVRSMNLREVTWKEVLTINAKYQALLDQAEAGDLTLRQTTSRLKSIGLFNFPEELLLASDWLNHPFLATSLLSYAGVALSNALDVILHEQQAHIIMRSARNDGLRPGNETMLAVELQRDYLQPQIRAHAKRVAAHQLGSEQAIYTDIEETMTAVWRSMPQGFGRGDQRVSNPIPTRRITVTDIISV
ncbi:hypothetical protein RhiLY_08805 [Ceratobasidium sp. AG-Ba]|nr:hypothetical protein RhiLY_08805 [Ceratobasidium sp. AG-Ba]